VAVTPANLKEASRNFRIFYNVLVVVKLNMRIPLVVRINFVGPVVVKPIEFDLRGWFTSLEIDVG
jgi:hypothetical protein